MKYSCYYIICFGCLMGFIIHFSIIFGTNLLTGGPIQIVVFCLFQYSKKRNIKRSPNGMKPSEKLFLERKQYRRLGVHARASTRRARGRGRAHPPGRALHPRGPLVASLTDFFRLYISIYPKTIGEQNRSGVPPPQASVATKNKLGPCSGTLPEGGREPSPVAIFIIPALSMMRREVGGQAVLGRQLGATTPWLTERHGYDPTW